MKGAQSRFLVKEPNMSRKGGFLIAKQTFDIPANATHVSLGLEARFTGSLEVSALHLEKKD